MTTGRPHYQIGSFIDEAWDNREAAAAISPYAAIALAVTDIVIKAKKGDKKAKKELKEVKKAADAGDPVAKKTVAAAEAAAKVINNNEKIAKKSWYDSGVAIGHDPMAFVGAVQPGYSWVLHADGTGHWERTRKGQKDVPSPTEGPTQQVQLRDQRGPNGYGGGGNVNLQNAAQAAQFNAFLKSSPGYVNRAVVQTNAGALQPFIMLQNALTGQVASHNLPSGWYTLQGSVFRGPGTGNFNFYDKRGQATGIDAWVAKNGGPNGVIWKGILARLQQVPTEAGIRKGPVAQDQGKPTSLPGTPQENYLAAPDLFNWQGFSLDPYGNILGPDGKPWQPPAPAAYQDPYGGAMPNPYDMPYGMDPYSMYQGMDQLDPYGFVDPYAPAWGGVPQQGPYGYQGYDQLGDPIVKSTTNQVYDPATDSFFSNQQKQIYDEETGTFITPQTYNPYNNSFTTAGAYVATPAYLANVDKKPGFALGAREMYHQGMGAKPTNKTGVVKSIIKRIFGN